MRNLSFKIFKRFVRIFSGLGLSRIWPISIFYKFLFSNLKPDYVEFEGHKISFPKTDVGDISHDISLFNRWGEKNEVETFKTEIKNGNTVIDLGAHIGYYTLLAAKLVGPSGKVYAFEPDPSNFEILKKNVDQNGYKNIICVNKAVSNKTGKTNLFLAGDTDNSQIVDSSLSDKSIEVDVITLDDFFKNEDNHIDFIKMDIEGSEGKALEGMKNLVTKNKNVKILTEFFPERLQYAIDAEKYLEMLSKYNFTFYDVNGEKKQPVTKEYLLKTYLAGKKKFEKGRVTNLLCVRNN